MTIEEIKKIRTFRHVDLSKVIAEAAIVSTLMLNPIQAMQSNYHVHKVPVNGISYFAADAKVLNRYVNQSGRGNMRHLFSLQTREWEGIAREIDNGNYRRVV